MRKTLKPKLNGDKEDEEKKTVNKIDFGRKKKMMKMKMKKKVYFVVVVGS